MVAITPNRRSDEQPGPILCETANRTANGVQGVVAGVTAIEKAAKFTASAHEVVAVVRRPPEIVTLSGQLRKLTNLLSDSQNSQTPCKLGHAGRVSVAPLNDSDSARIGFEGRCGVYQEARV
jgi:hypothetical protein